MPIRACFLARLRPASCLFAIIGLAFLTGQNMPRLKVPYGIALISAFVSEGIANIRKHPPLAPIAGVRLARSSMAFNCSKARRELGWQPPLNLDRAIGITADWYRAYYANPSQARDLTEAQIADYRRQLHVT